MHCSTYGHRAARRHLTVVIPPLLVALTLSIVVDAAAQGRTITQFPYSQSFTFVPSGTGTTPSGPIGAPVFPSSDVDGGELTVDGSTSSTMVNGSGTGLNNNVGAGGVLRIQTSGAAPPTNAQGFIAHASFTGRIAGSISIDWTKVSNGTSTRASELRIAVSADGGAYSNIASASFDNSAAAQTGTLSTTLPNTLDGVADVRFHIYAINVGGSGSHPRLVVDNLAIDAESDTPLPVELASFTASASAGAVSIRWRTASEHDNAGFEILRALGRDSLFEVIASWLSDESLRGLGTSPTGRDYGLDDPLPASLLLSGGSVSYRLVDVALDGTRTDHGIRTVRIESARARPDEGSALVHLRLEPPTPMPANDRLVARFTLAREEPVSLEIIAANGESALRQAPEVLASGSHERELDVSALTDGVYMLVVRTAGATRARPMVIVGATR